MEKNMEGHKKSSLDRSSREEQLAASIRAKREQGLTLTLEEQRFINEQQEENRKDDNPYKR